MAHDDKRCSLFVLWLALWQEGPWFESTGWLGGFLRAICMFPASDAICWQSTVAWRDYGLLR